MAVSRDGSKVVTGSCDETVRIWDATTSQPLLTFEGHSSGLESMAFSPDGSKVVSNLYVSDDWLSDGQEDIIWLPPDHRTTCVTIW